MGCILGKKIIFFCLVSFGLVLAATAEAQTKTRVIYKGDLNNDGKDEIIRSFRNAEEFAVLDGKNNTIAVIDVNDFKLDKDVKAELRYGNPYVLQDDSGKTVCLRFALIRKTDPGNQAYYSGYLLAFYRFELKQLKLTGFVYDDTLMEYNRQDVDFVVKHMRCDEGPFSFEVYPFFLVSEDKKYISVQCGKEIFVVDTKLDFRKVNLDILPDDSIKAFVYYEDDFKFLVGKSEKYQIDYFSGKLGRTDSIFFSKDLGIAVTKFSPSEGLIEVSRAGPGIKRTERYRIAEGGKIVKEIQK